MASRPRRSSAAPTNLVVSLVFHGLIIAAFAFLAAREGFLGKQLKTIAVTMAPKEKPPEPEKPKEPEKVPEPKPTEQPTTPVPPPPTAPVPTATVPPPTAAPPVAPPPAEVPSFSFSDGAKVVDSTSDPIQLYRGYVEFTLRSKWVRPEGVADEQFIAEVELSVGPGGEVVASEWKKGSGHDGWDQSVRQALAASKLLGRPPPKDFPKTFRVRFDVATQVDASDLP